MYHSVYADGPEVAVQPLELIARYEHLYSSLVSDCAEAYGLGPRCAQIGLEPYHADSSRVAVGFAHTLQVRRTKERIEIDMLLRAVEATPLNSLVVVATDVDVEGALWGGLMTTGVVKRGGRGAVVDGGIRDLHQVLPQQFPVWALYRSPLDIRGRGEIASFGEPVNFRGVNVAPGDLIFADANGVVALPAEAAPGVLDLCEERLDRELLTAAALEAGESATEVYSRHGAF